MSIESDSPGELYQYFLIEAPELLQTIEETLMSLIEEKTVEKVHTLMRSAHTLKGSAASVEQATIQTIAHHLEDVFEALYPEELEIDRELGGLLLEGYDCLREPLSATLSNLDYDQNAILEQTAAVFAQLQAKLGDFFGREAAIPTSEELGFDVVGSIFEDSIIQDLELLEETIVSQNLAEIESVLRSQVAFFSDLGITYDLPGLAAIAETTLLAIEQNPERVFDIAIAALSNFYQARAAIVAGDRQQGGTVSAELTDLLDETSINNNSAIDLEAELSEQSFFGESLDDNAEMTMMFSPEMIAESQTTNIAADLEPADNILANSELDEELQDFVDETSIEDDSAINLEEEFFDESFFRESPDDNGEMTMAFSPEMIAEDRMINVAADLEPEENIFSESDLDTPEEPAIIEEIATLESAATKNIPLNTNYDVVAKSPVEAILQSIVPVSVPLVNPDETNIVEEKNDLTTKQANKVLPSIKVPIEQLDRLHHTVGELLIKENQQNLQQEQLQLLLQETFQEFRGCQLELSRLGDLSEQQKRHYQRQQRKLRHQQQRDINQNISKDSSQKVFNLERINPKQNITCSHLSNNLSKSNNHNSFPQFDALEMDVYSDLDLKLQKIAENMTQLGNKIVAIERIARQSSLDTNKRKQLLKIAQGELLQARMLPLNRVFNRFPRHVRQMVSTYQKPAKFKTIGGEVTIDKAIAEKLYEPLLHLIRNAYDHGLESPEIRTQKGKSDVGKITVRAYNRGNRTMVEIKDDGKGIDLEKVLTKAIEKNLIEVSQLENISEVEITNFLFEPGFSTASQITDLSGRGVGLDIVKSQIKALDGTISVRSTPEEGTIFSLQLPLNITTARLLLCEDRGIIYGILVTEVKRVINPSSEQIQHQLSLVGNSQESFWRYQQEDRVELVPICDLKDVVDYSYPIIPRQSSLLDTLIEKKEKVQNRSLLLVEAEGKKVCLQVDRILNEQELVIKSLNTFVIVPNYIQGYSILGDGNLSLVINPVELATEIQNKFNSKSQKNIILSEGYSKFNLEEKITTYSKVTILVVEDSIVQRQSLVRILNKGNYEILQASNGQEAIAILEQNSQVNLIISDIEMPVMNGFELLIACQSNSQFSQIPLMMITTRSEKKHRQLASSLGAKAYMTKPAKERELLKIVDELVAV